MANNKLQQQAADAAEALKDAQKKQAGGDYDGAGKDIERARESLGKGKNENGQSGKDDKSQTGDSDSRSGKEQEKTSAAGQENNKIDNKQADALLENMVQDEKNLRDAIKSNQRQRRMKVVEKDW